MKVYESYVFFLIESRVGQPVEDELRLLAVCDASNIIQVLVFHC